MNRRSRVRRLFFGSVLVLSLNLTPALAHASSLQLEPVSLSFPTAHVGYVLSLYKCANQTCAALRSTSDGGSTWTDVSTPSDLNKDLRLVSWGTFNTSYSTPNIHFANAKDGWIYGSVPTPDAATPSYPDWASRLWSTHDGGKTWRRVRLDPLSISAGVTQMATSGGWTYLFGGSNTSGNSYILTTHSNVDKWTDISSSQMGMPAGGTPLQGAFNFVGDSGWFVAGNDRGITASARLSRNGSWNKWKGPSFKDLGASFCPIAAVTRKLLLAACESPDIVLLPTSSVPTDWNNGASWLFISYNAGATFQPFRQLSRTFEGNYFAVPGLPATPVPGTILLEKGLYSGDRLVRSTNWGRQWHTVLNHPVVQVAFASRSTGFAIAQQRTNQADTSLFATNDAGAHWHRASF
jgi:hypothetical protein